MIKFLFKGLIRDKNRSLLPIMVVAIGVFLAVFATCWVTGIMGDMIDFNANFSTGHVKIMTRAYAENAEQVPNDLALMDVGELKESLGASHPDMLWVERIHFGGLMDLADENGETRAQGPAAGMAVDLLSPGTKEPERLNILNSLKTGTLPQKAGEALISHGFAEKFKVKPGDEITLFGSTMYGSMTFKNFLVSGTVKFGFGAMDRGAIIIDISDAQLALDMEDAAGEVLGYFQEGGYDDEKATLVANAFNSTYEGDEDEFAPQMLRLKDQNQLASYLDYVDNMSGYIVFILVFALSIVLWNAGLLGGLRRYSEFGVRLALGEEKGHLFKTLIIEAVLIGIIGSVLGTFLGLIPSYYLQKNGIDFSFAMENSSMMMPSVYRAVVKPEAFYIGFIPGLFSMVLGNALSGIGIYRRKTAKLFKELEV